MARNYYLSELDFRNLTTVKGISVDQISQISGISPSTIRKAIRERKIDKTSLYTISKAICCLNTNDQKPFHNAALNKKNKIDKQFTEKAYKKYQNYPSDSMEKYIFMKLLDVCHLTTQ